MPLKRPIILVAFVAVLSSAQAEVSIVTSSTRHSISVSVDFQDAETTGGLRFRPYGVAPWAIAHPLVHDEANGRYTGSIVGLKEGTTYELQLTSQVAGEKNPQAPVQVSTLRAPITGNTRTLHVAPRGNDNHPGTEAQPFRTIQHAVDGALPGDTVHVAGGVYQEQVTIEASGTPDKWITLRGDPYDLPQMRMDAKVDHAFVIKGAKYVAIEGFTIESPKASAVLLTSGSAENAVTSNTISNPGTRYFDSAIEVGPGCSGAIISNNTIIYDQGRYTGGRMGISLRKTNGGHIIYGNRIIGNGLIKDGIGGEPNFELNGGAHQDSDIYNNWISGCEDDGIESEGANTNVRIWGNRIKDCLVGIAVAPVIKGPCYVWRNTITNCGPAFKLGEGDRMGHGHLFLYHNTSYTTIPEDSGYAGSGGAGLFQNVHGRNNLIVSNGPLFYDRRSQLSNSFDYDLLHSANPNRLMAWGKDKKKMTLQDAQKLGFWKHAITSNPMLNSPPGDVGLSPASAAVDAALPIPNFNDHYMGKAPDIGAVESH